jgi:hypothetical protein
MAPLIPSGQAIGITPRSHRAAAPEAGLTYRPVGSAGPARVRLAWWRDDRPDEADGVVDLARQLYSRAMRTTEPPETM